MNRIVRWTLALALVVGLGAALAQGRISISFVDGDFSYGDSDTGVITITEGAHGLIVTLADEAMSPIPAIEVDDSDFVESVGDIDTIVLGETYGNDWIDIEHELPLDAVVSVYSGVLEGLGFSTGDGMYETANSVVIDFTRDGATVRAVFTAHGDTVTVHLLGGALAPA